MGINTEVDLIAVFIFYKIASGVQAKLAFNADFKHCNVITYDGSDWIMLDFDQSGLLTRKIKCENGSKLVKSLPIIQDVTATLILTSNYGIKRPGDRGGFVHATRYPDTQQ